MDPYSYYNFQVQMQNIQTQREEEEKLDDEAATSYYADFRQKYFVNDDISILQSIAKFLSLHPHKSLPNHLTETFLEQVVIECNESSDFPAIINKYSQDIIALRISFDQIVNYFQGDDKTSHLVLTDEDIKEAKSYL